MIKLLHVSFQVARFSIRPEGRLFDDETQIESIEPRGFAVLVPLIHVHSFVEGL